MQKFLHWLSRAWLVLLVAAIVIMLDQWTKGLIRANLAKFEVMRFWDVLGDYFVFEHVDNYGAAFGMFQNQGNFFIVVAAIVAIGILVYARYLPTDAWIVRVLLGLQLGGAVGNVIDRINQGYVTDFVKMGIPGVYYWPNYNIADAAIVTGVIGLGIYIVVDDMRNTRRAKELAVSASTVQESSPVE